MSLQQSDAEAAAVSRAPRVTLTDIDNAIASRYDLNAYDVVSYATGLTVKKDGSSDMEALKCLSICILVTKSGFTIIGKSAPASPENFNAVLGKKFAYEDAQRQLWPLMGFALRDRLHGVTAQAAAV